MAETESYTIPEEPGVYRMERGRWTPCRTNNGIPISVQFSGEGNRAFFQHSGIPLRNMLVVYPDSGGSLGMVAFDAGGNAEWFKGLGYIQIQALLVRENSVCILRSCRQDVL